MTQPEQHFPSLAEIRQSASRSGYFHLLGMDINAAQEGTAVVSAQVDERHFQPNQIVHGGVIFTLADTAMSMALLSVLPAHTIVSTIEAKINYMRPVRTGDLSAEASIIHRGRSTAVLEATVYNIDGDERYSIAKLLGTFHISQSRSAHPSPPTGE